MKGIRLGSHISACMIGIIGLTGCGGETGSQPVESEPHRFRVSATSNDGGAIYPTSIVVNQGQVIPFELNTNVGYSIETVSGCDGALAGNIYTTSIISAACIVNASFSLNSNNVQPMITDFSYDIEQQAFHWQVIDDGDELTCFIRTDVFPYSGYVTEIEKFSNFVVTNCSVVSEKLYSYQIYGEINAQLIVTDGKGGMAQQTIELLLNAPGPDLWVRKVELAQTIVKENLRLVEGKPAKVFAHVITNIKEQSNVVTMLNIYLENELKRAVPMTGPYQIPTSIDPLNMNAMYVASLPADYVTAGLRLEVVTDVENEISEYSELNNSYSIAPDIGPGIVLPVTVIPIEIGAVLPEIPDFSAMLVNIFPIRGVEVKIATSPITKNWILVTTQQHASLLDDLQQRHQPGSARLYMGFIPYSKSASSQDGFASGLLSAIFDDKGAAIISHEVGHNLSLLHIDCDNPFDPDNDFPYQTTSIGVRGYDAINDYLIAPDLYSDTMTYCWPKWISDYNYDKAFLYLEQTFQVNNN